MGIILDTNIFIDIEHKRKKFEHLDTALIHEEAYISSVTVSELLAGVLMTKSTEIKIQRSAFVEGILNNLPALPFNEDVARTYAELYVYFIKQRSKSGATVHDLQIAATAITHGYTVLTSNIKDFKKIPGLSVKSF